MENNNDLVLGLFIGAEAHALSTFAPSYLELQKSDDSNAPAKKPNVKKLRSNYTPAVMFNLLFGLIASILTKKPQILIVAVVVCVAMIVLYEQAINKIGK